MISTSERSVAESGGCNFCDERGAKVFELRDRNRMGGGLLVRICRPCAGDLVRDLRAYRVRASVAGES